MELNMDFVGKDGVQGDVANRFQANGKMDPGQLRPFIGLDGKAYVSYYKGGDRTKLTSYASKLVTNATLRRDEWKQLDQTLLDLSKYRLGGIADLESHGLVFNLGNAMGTTVLEYHDIGDAFNADLTMDGITRSQGDRPEYQTKYLPIPIIHVDYEINARVLAASRSLGNPLDTTSTMLAGRKVQEKLEDMLFTSTSYTWGGGTIYSYLNHPNINTQTLSVNWDASAKTGAHIVAEVNAMKQLAINAKHFGPYQLYIPTAYETVLDEDYDVSGQSNMTIRERILKLENIKGVKVIDTLPANNVLLVQMTPDVVRLVKGMGITNIEWKEEGNFVTKYKVMTIQVPQVRSDQDGNSGIVLLS